MCDWSSVEQFEDVYWAYKTFNDLFTHVCDKLSIYHSTSQKILSSDYIEMNNLFVKRDTVKDYK